MHGMRVGVIDVGSNTVRLLVAGAAGGGVVRVRETREVLGLGAEIERTGSLSEAKIEETIATVAECARLARVDGAVEVAALITSPGRQARNGAELAERILRSTGVLVRVLSAEDEGRFAYAGALAQAEPRTGLVAVCDVGGGSSQIAIGEDSSCPSWVRSIDIGSLRLTQRCIPSDPPLREELLSASAEASAIVGRLVPPLPRTALATGGTARALGKIVGSTLDARTLERALGIVQAETSKSLSRRFGSFAGERASCPPGRWLFSEAQLVLGVPLEVARGGLREGAALELLRRAEAVA